MAITSSTLDPSSSNSPTLRGAGRLGTGEPRRHLGRRIPSTFRAAFAAALAFGASFGTANVHAQGERPDQVTMVGRGARARIETQSGTVTSMGLDRIEIDKTEGGSSAIDSSRIVRVTFGTVPPSYRDGRQYMTRGDYENAAAQFRIAAGDASAREVVQARARLLAGESLLRWGATDPVRLAEAAEELNRFIGDHGDNLELPKAQALRARALLLLSDGKAAGELYRSIFQKLDAGTPAPGYNAMGCLRAGLAAGRAFFDAGDSLAGREILQQLDSACDAVIGQMSPDDSDRTEATNIQGEAQLGPAYADLAGGNTRQALTTFEGNLRRADPSSPATYYGSAMGKGLCHQAEGEMRAAQLEFAKVAALDYIDRDRVAQAYVSWCECANILADEGYLEAVQQRLQIVVEQYGDTPAAATARAMME